MKEANQSIAPHRSRLRRFALALTTVVISTCLALGACEVVFRVMEYKENARNVYEGEGGRWLKDARWGWKPSSGTFRSATAEYDVKGSINTLSMNDEAFD